MSYEEAMNRATPGCFLFLLDQSSSMMERIQGQPDKGRKSEFIADAINRTITNLIVKATKGESEPRRYYQIGVIGYGGEVGSVLGDALGWRDLVWIDELYANPLRIEQRMKKTPDGAGGIIEVPVRFPVWFDPVANGQTPMCAALELAKNAIAQWAMEFPESYPPVVLNLTDGEANDGDPRGIAEEIRSVFTKDGNALLLTLHVSSNEYAGEILFPQDIVEMPNLPSRIMFEMTSELPNNRVVQNEFRSRFGRDLGAGTKGIIYNGGIEAVINFLDIGTSTAVDDRMRIDP